MLGTVDFSAVKDFEVLPTDTYEAQTKSWEVKQNIAGDGQHLLVKYTTEFDGMQRTVPDRYSLKPNSLWVLKRDLIALGVDPEALKGQVDGHVLTQIMDELYSSPLTVLLDIDQEVYTPAGGEPRLQNVVTRVYLPEE